MRHPRRRDVLRTGSAALALSAVGSTASAAGTSSAGSAAGNYEPQGALDIANAAEVVVHPNGETAYVAVGTGFVTVDVSVPASPTILSETAGLTDPDGTPIQEVLDVKYDDGTVVVPTAAHGGGPKGFYVFDVTDPANPTQVGSWFPTPDHGNHNSAFVDGIVYLTGGLTLDIVDVSGETFERVGTWEPGDWKDEWSTPTNTVLHDVYVQGDHAYCSYWDGGTFILDVSDPSNPAFVSRVGDYTLEEIADLSRQAYLEPAGNDHYATVNEDATLMAEGGESWDLDPADEESGGPSGISLFDVADKPNPEKVAHIDPPVSGNNTYQDGTWTTAHNFDLQNGKLYASWYQGGVTIHDVSDPTTPERLAWWAAPDERAFWTAQVAVDGEFFVASSHEVNGTTPGLLTFPDEPGQMAEEPTSVAWSMDELDAKQPTTTTTTTPTSTTEPTTSEPPTTEPTTTESMTTPTEDDDGGDGSGDSGSTPGFGILTAIGGLGVGAARYLQRRSSDD